MEGFAGAELGEPEAETVEKKPRIWADAELADYIREELGYPGARQGAMVEKLDITTGEVSRELWYLLTSLSSGQCGPRGLLKLFRDHWSIENSQHHVKDRSWDEDIHTLRRPGLGEAFATLVNTALNALRLLSSPSEKGDRGGFLPFSRLSSLESRIVGPVRSH